MEKKNEKTLMEIVKYIVVRDKKYSIEELVKHQNENNSIKNNIKSN